MLTSTAMWFRRASMALFITVGTVAVITAACGDDGSALAPSTSTVNTPSASIEASTTNESLDPSRVEIDGYVYNCITYTKVDRGGVWCDRISVP